MATLVLVLLYSSCLSCFHLLLSTIYLCSGEFIYFVAVIDRPLNLGAFTRNRAVVCKLFVR